MQHVAVAAGQVHAGIVHQGGFVDGNVQAVVAAQGQRSLRGADLIERGLVVQVFLAVPFEGGKPPGGGRAGEGEFGQFGIDLRLLHGRLLREFITEADAIVVDAEHHVEATPVLAPATGLFGEAGAQLVVVVAGETAFAPGLLPGFIKAATGLTGQHDVALQAPVTEQEAQPRRRDHRFTLALHAVGQAPLVVRLEGDSQHVAG
ncbi:hypothetical protein D3C81_669990 [compost metagenome]